MNCLNGPSLESPEPIILRGLYRQVWYLPESTTTSQILLFLCWWSHCYLHQLPQLLSAARILKHDAQTKTRSVELHPSFLHTTFSLLAVQLSSLSVPAHLDIFHPPNRFLYPCDFTKYYYITRLPCNPKIMEDGATYLGLLVAKVLPPFHRQAVCRIQRSVLDLSSALLLKISVLCSSPSGSTPLGHRDISIHNITH